MPESFLDRFRITDQVAIITGAGKGIGAATALMFAEAGADVVITARTLSDLEEVAQQVRARGRRALTRVGDVNDLDHLASLVDTTVAEFGRLDILVNNAGGTAPVPFADLRADHLTRALHFNVVAPFELSRLAAPHLLAGEGGAIVNISSMAGVKANRGMFGHSLTKAALNQLTKVLAAELAPRVRVNAVLPGAIETDALRRYLDTLPDTVRAGMRDRTAMRRNGTPEDIAAAVLYLVSPASGWITGKLHEVDGSANPEILPRRIPDLGPGDL